MKKVFYAGFCLMLAMGVGCAITNYDVIVDDDQTANGQGSGVVNTSGKAHIQEGIQIATLYSDGSDELFSMIDQKSDGTASITTYNNFSTGSDPTFHDDQYCNPDWAGCAIFTAPDNNDSNLFDGSANANCSGARSLSVLLSTSRYYGECGRTKMPLADQLSFYNMGRLGSLYGSEGLFYDLNRNTFSILLDNNAGTTVELPMIGSASLFIGEGKKGVVDLRNSLVGATGRAYADWLANTATNETDVTFCFNEICTSFNIAGNVSVSNPSRWLANIDSHF